MPCLQETIEMKQQYPLETGYSSYHKARRELCDQGGPIVSYSC